MGFFKRLLLKQVREASHLPNLNLTRVRIVKHLLPNAFIKEVQKVLCSISRIDVVLVFYRISSSSS